MGYIQVAQGSFSIEVIGDRHCGPNHDSPKVFAYEVEVSYPDEALDGNGFLLDNLHFENYFKGLGETELSCELLARMAAREIHAATEERAISTQVGIWAIPGKAKVVYRVG